MTRREKRTGRAWNKASLMKVALLCLFLAALAVRLYLATLPGYEDDTTHFKWWTRLVTQEGLSQAYSGTYPQTYAIYPPLMLLCLKIVGHLYQGLFSPSFALDGPQLGFMIKGLGVFFDVLTWMVIFVWVRKRSGFAVASFVTLAYAFNPAVIFDLSYWGQPDSIHSFFLVLSILLLVSRRPGLAWASLAAAAFVKPQAWVILPLAVVATLLTFGPKGVLKGAASAAGVSLALIAPFLLNHTFRQLMTLPDALYGAMPVLSANAHNIWWLYSPGPALVPDDGRAWLVSQRTFSLLLLAVFYVFALWRLRARGGAIALPAITAFVGFSFFMLPTRVHENHGYMVLPLLAVAMAGDSRLRWVFGALSLTFLANLALHDPPLTARLWAASALPYWQPLQVANSVLNTLTLLAWVVMLAFDWRKAPAPDRTAGAAAIPP
ncbi:MAG: hypothetical protein Q7R39_11995 [Dehalococcoidia bacterium]|nr:hypothetical protein [Dehalococcoidia bacterium]